MVKRKSPGYIRRELEADRAAAERRQLIDLGDIEGNPARLITAACLGQLAAERLTRPRQRAFCAAIGRSDADPVARDSLRELLLVVHERADFLFEDADIEGRQMPYLNGLIKLNDRRRNWLAQPKSWRPASHNVRKQFSSLARHLMARFAVPTFMDEAWLDPLARKKRDWFVHIGLGKNIRTAKTPLPFTKMIAHHFLAAPDSYTIDSAIRWGQVHALGGDRRLVEALLPTRLRRSFDNDEFWTGVMRFFVANPLLDRRHVGPIIDYLHAQKFVGVEVAGDDGTVTVGPPPQPNLSMRGRSPTALLTAVERWHADVGRRRRLVELKGRGQGAFSSSGLPGGEVTEPGGFGVWRIHELLSTDALIAEGQQLHHCVATYAKFLPYRCLLDLVDGAGGDHRPAEMPDTGNRRRGAGAGARQVQPLPDQAGSRRAGTVGEPRRCADQPLHRRGGLTAGTPHQRCRLRRPPFRAAVTRRSPPPSDTVPPVVRRRRSGRGPSRPMRAQGRHGSSGPRRPA